MTTIAKSDFWDSNLIGADGFYSPFVAEIDGKICVGDCHNLDEFESLDVATRCCRTRLLSPDAFVRSMGAAETDPDSRAATEYRWHCDALLQLSALRRLRNAGTRV